MDFTSTTLNQDLRSLRTAARYTQAEAAKAARLSRSRLAALESGAATNIELATLLRLLDLYGMELHARPRTPRKSLNRVMQEAAERERAEAPP